MGTVPAITIPKALLEEIIQVLGNYSVDQIYDESLEEWRDGMENNDACELLVKLRKLPL